VTAKVQLNTDLAVFSLKFYTFKHRSLKINKHAGQKKTTLHARTGLNATGLRRFDPKSFLHHHARATEGCRIITANKRNWNFWKNVYRKPIEQGIRLECKLLLSRLDFKHVLVPFMSKNFVPKTTNYGLKDFLK
jgi:hypothetical protein